MTKKRPPPLPQYLLKFNFFDCFFFKVFSDKKVKKCKKGVTSSQRHVFLFHFINHDYFDYD